jgi:NADPH2:quinone reductase
MKAAYIEKVGSPDVIQFGELPNPEYESNQLLVKVVAVAVNPVDTYIRSGLYSGDLDFPYIIGRDAVGVVEKVGSQVDGFKKGDLVWTCTQGKLGSPGTFAEYIAVDQDLLYPLPPGVDPKDAAALILASVTATTGIISAAQLKETDTIFVNGGSGSVGSAVIQLSKALGATVIAAAGSNEKVEWCKQIGADHTFNYNTENIEERILSFVPYGVDVYWETSRTPDLELAVRVAGEHGRIVLMAGKKDYHPPLPINLFYNKQLSLNGFTVADLSPTNLSNFARIINRCLKEKLLKAKIAIELPLSEASKAHKILEENKNLWGKIVLTL